LSSAILYLAIVAIWAVVLVPRWLRASHTGPRQRASNPAEPPGPRAELAWAADDVADEDPGGWRPADQEEGPAAGGYRSEPASHAEPDRDRWAAAVHPSAAERRARILQARRRTLVTLVVLTAGAVGITVTHLAASWVIVPPAVMLAGFVLLLREAARIDAGRALASSRRSGPEADARGAETGSVRADAADWDARPGRPDDAAAPEPTAEIIDISDRVGDQLYDQYTDAAARAVGD
jgi:hypothetical protein